MRRTGCCARVSSCREREVDETHLFGERAEVFRVDVCPDALHVVPICHDPVRDRVAEGDWVSVECVGRCVSSRRRRR